MKPFGMSGAWRIYLCIAGQVRVRQPLGSRDRTEGTVAPAVDRVEERPGLRHGDQAAASRSRTGRNQVTAPIFLLVPQVKLPKRLDLARDADRALDSVPGLIVANWVEERI